MSDRKFESNFSTDIRPNLSKIIDNSDAMVAVGVTILRDTVNYLSEVLNNPEFESQVLEITTTLKPAIGEIFAVFQTAYEQAMNRVETLKDSQILVDADTKLNVSGKKFKDTFAKKAKVFGAKMYVYMDQLETIAEKCVDNVKTKIKWRHSFASGISAGDPTYHIVVDVHYSDEPVPLCEVLKQPVYKSLVDQFYGSCENRALTITCSDPSQKHLQLIADAWNCCVADTISYGMQATVIVGMCPVMTERLEKEKTDKAA